MLVDGDISSINKQSIFTSIRGMYQLLKIRASKRCVSIALNPNIC